MRVGWLGLGAMGAPMAACLVAAGHAVSAYDVMPDRAPQGASAAASVPEAVTGADAIVVMVATPEQLDQVLSSAAPCLVPGQAVAIMSTVGPEAVAAAAARLEPAGVAVVDAPVSGGVTRAGQGDLLILVGGTAEAVARVQPLFDALAQSAPVVGPSPGDGQRMKLVNQLLCGVHIAAAAEALSFAESLGLNPGECRKILHDGAAASFMFDDRGERMVSGHFDDVRSALDIFVKDMGLVTSAAGDSGAHVPLSTAAQQLYQRGHDRPLSSARPGRGAGPAGRGFVRRDRPRLPNRQPGCRLLTEYLGPRDATGLLEAARRQQARGTGLSCLQVSVPQYLKPPRPAARACRGITAIRSAFPDLSLRCLADVRVV